MLKRNLISLLSGLGVLLMLSSCLVTSDRTPTGLPKASKEKVATPTFDPTGGNFTVDRSVSLSCATPDVNIYYTTDGSEPTSSSESYSTPIHVTGLESAVTIKAFAAKDGLDDSDVAEATYVVIYPQLDAPIITPASGSFSVDKEVTITAAPGTTIYYTTNGSTPTAGSFVYSDPISVAGSGTTETIKAIAVEEQKRNSEVASETYIINYLQLDAPVMSPLGGTFSVDTDVTITAVLGTTIYYTTNGSDPTTGSYVYSAPISVTGSGTVETIKAIAVGNETLNSSTSSNQYTINYDQVSVPQISPIAGIYDDYQSATISCSTDGAAIHYTTDGSNPTSSSTLYTGAFSVSTSETIKAIAIKSMMLDSEVSSDAIVLKVATPVISLAPGTYNSDQSLTITCNTAGAAIHYTTDGSTPTSSSTSYTGEISVSASETVKAIAIKTGIQNSEVANDAIVLQVAIPVMSPASGAVAKGTAVTITTTTSGATIHYTTDGSTPTALSTLYTTPIVVNAATTIKAIALETGYDASSVASASYTRLYTMSHFAGPLGGIGNADGIGANASFYYPSSAATDGTNLYVVDSYNYTIRKVVIATGEVTTFAGSAVKAGTTDGFGTAARFNKLEGVVIDPAGANLYVTDYGNNTIRKIVIATAQVTTFAGTAGSAGTTDGIGTAAKFNVPKGITIDPTGTNLYVADYSNNTIRKIVIATAQVITFAGTAGSSGSVDGIGIAAKFGGPEGITIDPTGTNIYVSEYSNKIIRKIVIATAQVTIFAGTAGASGSIDGIGTAARFGGLEGITIDPTGTNLYATDYSNNTIRKIVIATAQVTTFAGTAGSAGYTDGIGTAARFDGSRGIMIDPTGTNLYVSGYYSHTIRKILISTAEVSTLAGTAGGYGTADGVGTAARFMYPTNITTDGTNIYVADYNNHTIRKIVIATGAVTTLAGTAYSAGSTNGIGTAAKFNFPAGVTLDSTGTNLYVTDGTNNTIRKIVLATAAVTTFAGTVGSAGSTDGVGTAAKFSNPKGITNDGTNLYVADYANNTIRKIVISTAQVTTFVGAAGVSGSIDGVGTGARLYNPKGITIDSTGANLYVTDYSNNTVRRIVTTTGEVTTLAGTAGVAGSMDGTGAAASFYQSNGITPDATGSNLYVADYGNNTIRKIVLATGEVTTFAGIVGVQGHIDGTLDVATFSGPVSVLYIGDKLFVLCYFDYTLRQIQ